MLHFSQRHRPPQLVITATSRPATTRGTAAALPAGRANAVQKHFDSALGADDFMQRVEMVLYAFGFTGDNSIGEPSSAWLHYSLHAWLHDSLHAWLPRASVFFLPAS
jgi:hypothetical protein